MRCREGEERPRGREALQLLEEGTAGAGAETSPQRPRAPPVSRESDFVPGTEVPALGRATLPPVPARPLPAAGPLQPLQPDLGCGVGAGGTGQGVGGQPAPPSPSRFGDGQQVCHSHEDTPTCWNSDPGPGRCRGAARQNLAAASGVLVSQGCHLAGWGSSINVHSAVPQGASARLPAPCPVHWHSSGGDA